MKKISLMALVAVICFSACTKQEQEPSYPEENAPKALEFSLGINTLQTRMSDKTVNEKVAPEVRRNIENITIEYFNSANTLQDTYQLTLDQINMVKRDNQDGARVSVRIDNIPAITKKVNVRVNVKTATDINDLQTPYTIMEYRGAEAIDIKLKTIGGGGDGRDLYDVEVPVKPVLSRFEFLGAASDIKIVSILPGNIINGTKTQVQGHVSDATIAAGEEAAREAWKKAHSGSTIPTTWTYTYSVAFFANTNSGYTIGSIDGYYMNNIPLTKDGALVLNANSQNGEWNASAKANYDATTGSMKKMFDTKVDADKTIAYNLFPQTFTPVVAGKPTIDEVKTNMPHFILKLTASDGPRWVTVRAFKSTAVGTPLIDNFEAGKAYLLKASEIIVNQYSAKLTVTATNAGNSTPGTDIPEDKDPTDPNPEPGSKDVEVLVKILEWESTFVKPEW